METRRDTKMILFDFFRPADSSTISICKVATLFTTSGKTLKFLLNNFCHHSLLFHKNRLFDKSPLLDIPFVFLLSTGRYEGKPMLSSVFSESTDSRSENYIQRIARNIQFHLSFHFRSITLSLCFSAYRV